MIIAPGSQSNHWPAGINRSFDIQLVGSPPRTERVEFQGKRLEVGF
jgi:hypothetical protein